MLSGFLVLVILIIRMVYKTTTNNQQNNNISFSVSVCRSPSCRQPTLSLSHTLSLTHSLSLSLTLSLSLSLSSLSPLSLSLSLSLECVSQSCARKVWGLRFEVFSNTKNSKSELADEPTKPNPLRKLPKNLLKTLLKNLFFCNSSKFVIL